MSYILEALRKSESERHQGEVPNLGASPMLIHAGRRERSSWPYWLAGALVLNAAVVGAWLLGSHSASTDAARVEPVVSSAEVTPHQAPVAEIHSASVAPSTAPGAAVAAATPMSAVGQQAYPIPGAIPGLGQPMQPRSPDPSSVAQHPRSAYPAAQPSASVQPQWDRVTPSNQGSQPLLITPDTARKSLAYDPELGYMDDTAPANFPVSPTAALSQISADTPAIDVPRLDELPPSFQARVPALTFNSHIYSSDPSARRVMVNNVYLREGQSYKGMAVQEITDEGAIFVLNGVMFEINAARGWGRR